MWQHVKNIWYPERYHGYKKSRPFFEGWYYKLVCPQKKHVCAVIPGIFLDKSEQKSHSFIQFLDSEVHDTLYQRYGAENFYAAKKSFDVKIGANKFDKNSITLNLNSNRRRIEGSLHFSDHHPWPVSLFSPGAMGWYSYVPFMECYHGILSFDCRITGFLNINGRHVNFTGGRGYIEKDWGISFPGAYVWIQSNHFEQEGISLFLSVAQIPWLGGAFRGFLAGFLFRGRLYRLTTYSGAKIEKISISGTHVHIIIRDNKYILDVEASRTEGGILFGPDGHSFFQHISETLKSKLKVVFSKKEKIIFEGHGSPAGLEINGKTEHIV